LTDNESARRKKRRPADGGVSAAAELPDAREFPDFRYEEPDMRYLITASIR